MKHIVFDEIPLWRPNWVDHVWKKLYYSKHLKKIVCTTYFFNEHSLEFFKNYDLFFMILSTY